MLGFLIRLFGPDAARTRELAREERRARSGTAVLLPLVAAGLLALSLTPLLSFPFAAAAGGGASLAAVLASRAVGRVMRGLGFEPVLCDRTATQCSHLLSFLLVLVALWLGRGLGVVQQLAPP